MMTECVVKVVLVLAVFSVQAMVCTVAQDCNDLVTITSSGTDVLVNTSISRFCLQCVDGNMVFDPNNTIWEINRATVIDSTPGVDEVAGVLVLVDPMQLLMDGGVTLECSDIIEYNIQVFSSTPVPPVVEPPVARTFTEGDNARVPCNDPNPSQLITELEWLDPHGNRAPANRGLLSLPSITRTQAGQYHCVLTAITNDTVSATLTITVQYSPDVTSQDPTSVQALPRTNVTLSCDFTGVPPPDVTWSHDGVVTAPGQGVAIVTRGNRSEFTVQGVTGERGGVYRCNVSNSIGSGSLDFTVETAPDPPTTLTTSISETSISLAWSYQSDRSSPRTGVEVELRSGVDIVSSTMVGPAQASITFSSLQPLTNYSLTVYVRSGVGRSDPATIHTSTLSLRLPQPTISTFQPTSSSHLLVQWEGAAIVTLTTAPPTGWRVELLLSSSGKVVEVVNVNGEDNTTVSLRGLESGTQYTVRVAGVNTRGPGNFSNPVTTITSSSSGITLTAVIVVLVIVIVAILVILAVVVYLFRYPTKQAHDPQQEDPQQGDSTPQSEPAASLTPCVAYGVVAGKEHTCDYEMVTGVGSTGHCTSSTSAEAEYETIS